MDRPFDALLDEVSDRLGYQGCVAHGRIWHVTDFLPAYGPVTAEQFAHWVFLAEDGGQVDRFDASCRRRDEIVDAFKRCLGAEVVDAFSLGRAPGEW